MVKLMTLPRTPLQFYVKLYCKRKGVSSSGSKNTVVEATKSWLSLTAQEKVTIVKKFKDSNANYKTKFAIYLKSAEPYLKKKKCIKEPQTTNEIQELADRNKLNERELEQDMPFQTTNQECSTHNASIRSIMSDIDDRRTEFEAANDQQPAVLDQTVYKPDIPEPAPPYICNAQQLYDILKSSDGTNSNWSSLTKLEKNRYQKAVLMLKKDYINKYKAYLESLPAEELFDYYNKNI